VFASPEVGGLYERLFAESWPVEVNPVRFRSDEAWRRVLARTAGHAPPGCAHTLPAGTARPARGALHFHGVTAEDVAAIIRLGHLDG
jgi:hypothetical protein